MTRDELGPWSRPSSRDTSSLGDGENAVQRASRSNAQAMTISRSQDGYRESVSPTRRADVPQEPRFSPPLLLPPPRSRTNALQQQLIQLTSIDRATLTHATRTGLFLAKLATLARPCFPYVARPEVSVPLVLVAALDFGGARRASAGWARLLLLVLHFVALWVARRWGALCVVPPRDAWAEWVVVDASSE